MLLPRATGETVTQRARLVLPARRIDVPGLLVSVPIEMPEGRGAVVAFTDIEERLTAERSCASAKPSWPSSRPRCAGRRARRRRRAVGGRVRRGRPRGRHGAAAAAGADVALRGRWNRDGDRRLERAPHPFRPARAGRSTTLTGLSQVRKTGRRSESTTRRRPGRDRRAVRRDGIGSAAGVPIVVDGECGGDATGSPPISPCRPTARSGSPSSPSWSRPRSPTRQARQELRRLAEEQAALRRVATLVARRPAGGDLRTRRRGGRKSHRAATWSWSGARPERMVTLTGAPASTLPAGHPWPLGREKRLRASFGPGNRARIDDYRAVSGGDRAEHAGDG